MLIHSEQHVLAHTCFTLLAIF